MLERAAIAVLLTASQLTNAIPFQQVPFSSPSPTQNDDFNVLHHLSGISPFFDSHGPAPDAPQGCVVISAAILARHSSITMNDDEWPETLGPFVEKLDQYDRSQIPETSLLAFLRDWSSPVNEDNQEELTGPGARDSASYGRRVGELYPDLIPRKHDPAFKIYTASSARDVDSATAFIHGLYPDRKLGTKPGQVDLVKVPNKNADWKLSLTPHKACDRFDKNKGKPERDAFAQSYTAGIIDRLRDHLPGWDWSWQDIVAMQQFCGYETVIRDSSPFCDVFDQNEWLHWEYMEDLYYHHMLGRHNKWTAALGVPWLQNAIHHLNDTATKPISTKKHPHLDIDYEFLDDNFKTSPLPKPTRGPNATLAQALQIWFTHREEVPIVTHALDLFHGHNHVESDMPLDHINHDRVWRTSEIIPFLGHVSLERMQCGSNAIQQAQLDATSKKRKGGKGRKKQPLPGLPPNTEAFVRIIVNGSPQVQPSCNEGPGNSCPLADFITLVNGMPAVYGDLEQVCKKFED